MLLQSDIKQWSCLAVSKLNQLCTYHLHNVYMCLQAVMCKVYKTENILRIEQIPYGSLNRAHRDVRRTFSRTKKSASQRDKAEQIESREMEQRAH